MQKMNDITDEDGDETWRVCKIDYKTSREKVL